MRQRKSRSSCTNSGRPAISYDRLRDKVIAFPFPRNFTHQGERCLVFHQLRTDSLAIDEHRNPAFAYLDTTYCQVFALISRCIDALYRKVLFQCICQLDIPFLVTTKHIKDSLGFDHVTRWAGWDSGAVLGHSETPYAIAYYGTLLNTMVTNRMGQFHKVGIFNCF